MSIHRILLGLSVTALCSLPVAAQTTTPLLAFGATTEASARTGASDQVPGANFIAGPVYVDSNARFGRADGATTLVGTGFNEQDVELKLSNISSWSLSNESVFYVEGVITGAVLATASGVSSVDLDVGTTGNSAYVASTFTNRARTSGDDTTDGGAGETAFSVQVTLAAAAMSDSLASLGINLPLRFGGCSSTVSNVTVEIDVRGQNAASDGPGTSLFTTAPGPITLIECFSPLTIAVAADSGDSQLSLGDRMRFAPGTAGPALNPDAGVRLSAGVADTAVTGTVGVVRATWTRPPDNATLLVALNDGPNSENLDGNGDYGDLLLDLALSGAATTADLRTVRAGYGTPDETSGLLPFAYTGAATSGAGASATLTIPFTLDLISSGAEYSQGVLIDLASVTDAMETLLSTAVTVSEIRLAYANQRDSVTFLAGDDVSASLDSLNPQLTTCGEFDKVGDTSQPYGNAIRVTGHAGTTSIIASLRNSTGSQTPPSLAVLQGVDLSTLALTITQEQLTTAFGDFGDADIVLGFEGITNAANLDCDRLVIFTDRNGLFVPFGNDRVATVNVGSADGDD